MEPLSWALVACTGLALGLSAAATGLARRAVRDVDPDAMAIEMSAERARLASAFEAQAAEMRVHVEAARSLLDQAVDSAQVAAQRHAKTRAAESRIRAKEEDTPAETEANGSAEADPWARIAQACAPFMVGAK